MLARNIPLDRDISSFTAEIHSVGSGGAGSCCHRMLSSSRAGILFSTAWTAASGAALAFSRSLLKLLLCWHAILLRQLLSVMVNFRNFLRCCDVAVSLAVSTFSLCFQPGNFCPLSTLRLLAAVLSTSLCHVCFATFYCHAVCLCHRSAPRSGAWLQSWWPDRSRRCLRWFSRGGAEVLVMGPPLLAHELLQRNAGQP